MGTNAVLVRKIDKSKVNVKKAPYGRELTPKAAEGEGVTMEIIQIQSRAGSFHHSVVPLPADATLTAGGRLIYAVHLQNPVVTPHPPLKRSPFPSRGRLSRAVSLSFKGDVGGRVFVTGRRGAVPYRCWCSFRL